MINKYLNKPKVYNFKKISNNYLMKCDIIEKNNEFHIYIDMPGFSKSNIKINFENNYLIVRGKRLISMIDNGEGEFLYRERYYGEKMKSFYIGEVNKDSIKASYLDGVLHLIILK